jgi:hypothetical protein
MKINLDTYCSCSHCKKKRISLVLMGNMKEFYIPMKQLMNLSYSALNVLKKNLKSLMRKSNQVRIYISRVLCDTAYEMRI